MKLYKIDKNLLASMFGFVISVGALITTLVTPEIRLFFGISSPKHVEETVSDKFRQLDQVELIMKQFQLFIDNQRKELAETNEVLLQLKSKKNELQSIVNTEEATIEAIFKLQEKRTSTNTWHERFVGFLIGVAGSLLASIIWSISIKIARRRNDQLKQPTVQP